MDCFWVYAVCGDWWPACLVRILSLRVCLVLVKCYVVYGVVCWALGGCLEDVGFGSCGSCLCGGWGLGDSSVMLFGGWVCYVCGLACCLLGCV